MNDLRPESRLIAASLIVRNGAATIERAVASVRPHVDEVTVYIAGHSSDGTPEILDRLATTPGAPIIVQQGEWRDDFAWARNQSLAMTQSEWFVWLDDDEVLQHGERLRDLVEGDAHGLWVRRVNDYSGELVYSWDKRVVRRRHARWIHPLHEQIRIQPENEWTSRVVPPRVLSIRHEPIATEGRHGYEDRVMRLFRAGREELLPYMVIYLVQRGDVAEAIRLLETYIDRPRNGLELYDARFVDALAGLGILYEMSGQWNRSQQLRGRYDALLTAWRADSMAPGRLSGCRATTIALFEADSLERDSCPLDEWEATWSHVLTRGDAESTAAGSARR